MKRLVLIIALLVGPFALAATAQTVPAPPRASYADLVEAAAQSTPPVGSSGYFFAFDYSDADFTAGAVTRFEMQLDANAFASVGIPTNTVPITGGKTYKVPIPAITPGAHTVSFRACNADLCSEATTPLDFRFAPLPATPRNVRIVSGD